LNASFTSIPVKKRNRKNIHASVANAVATVVAR
jgi:hypothetical protein